MAAITLNSTEFKAQYSFFALTDDAIVLQYFDMASNFISTENYGWLNGDARKTALYLLTAHLLTEAEQQALGNSGATGVLTNATEGSVSAGFAPPPYKTPLQYWVGKTTYGQQLLALIKSKSAMGVYAAGGLQQSNIRQPNGQFC